jgi:hypothetical protein
LLFYALSQGGRAIVAARGDEPRAHGHGLAEVSESDANVHLLHRRIRRKPTRNDLYGALTRALGAPDFSGEVELGAAWVANPALWRLPIELWRPEWRMYLHADDSQDGATPGTRTLRIMPFTEPLAAALDHGPDLLTDRYPTVPNEAEIVWQPPGTTGLRTWRAWLRLPDDEHWAERAHAIAPRAPFDRSGARYIPTALPGHTDALPPFLLWWLLLFGLSIFARYHPELWARTLDVDQSTVTVAIETALERAIDTMPAMIYDASHAL